MGTGIHVVAGINPAEAYLSLKVPVAVNDPGISVGYAKSTVPSLIAFVAEIAEIGAEHFEVKIYVADVVLTSESMSAHKMSLKRLTEPIAGFWLDHPVFPLVVVDRPCVQVTGKIDTPFWSK